ncbi:MAG: hypothetical protein HOI49_08690 [Bacteroidetes bacterium]|jgi:formiminoglutamase|nr:hypothetical protein [Bacteroidota bacterium]
MLRIYLMLQEYFTPIKDNTEYKPYHIGSSIARYASLFPDLATKRIALFAIRGEVNNQHAVRTHLYNLASNAALENILVDLGDIPAGETPADTNSAIYTVALELMSKGIIPVLLTHSVDSGQALYQAFESANKQIELAWISAHLPLLEYELLHRIIAHEPNYLQNLSAIGFQSHHIPPKAMMLLENLNFDHYRLGEVNNQIDDAELYLRNASLTLFDLNAVKHTDAPATQQVQANGLTAEQACQLARYAGASDTLQSFALLGYHSDKDHTELTAALCAQIIWYLADGVLSRKQDTPQLHTEFTKYRCDFSNEDVPILFIKSKRTGRWWMQIEHPAYPENIDKRITVPCTYHDYLEAANGDTPQRYLNALKKLD